MSAEICKILSIAGVSWLFLGQADAQVPQSSTATYDDWTVSCARATPPASQKICEMVQAQRAGDRPNHVGQITISRPVKNQPFEIFFQVPPDVWLQTGVKFVFDDNEAGLAAPFRWCIPARCLADTGLSDSVVNKIRVRTDPGRVEYKDASQHDISLPVSLKGFAPALDWMEKQ